MPKFTVMYENMMISEAESISTFRKNEMISALDPSLRDLQSYEEFQKLLSEYSILFDTKNKVNYKEKKEIVDTLIKFISSYKSGEWRRRAIIDFKKLFVLVDDKDGWVDYATNAFERLRQIEDEEAEQPDLENPEPIEAGDELAGGEAETDLGGEEGADKEFSLDDETGAETGDSGEMDLSNAGGEMGGEETPTEPSEEGGEETPEELE